MDNLYDLMAVWGGLDEKSLVGSRMRARTTLTPDTSGEFGTGAAMAPKFTQTLSVKKGQISDDSDHIFTSHKFCYLRLALEIQGGRFS